MSPKLAPALLATACLLLAACGPKPPLKVGFIGGLTDPSSDVAEGGRSAVLLAIDQVNRGGGIQGRMVELVVRDDLANKDAAAKGATELAEAGVEAVIGPFTSAMATAVAPALAKKDVLLVSPTITSMDFFGKDDNVVRINRTTRENARDYAKVLFGRGQKRIAVAYDTRNRNFTESWLKEFRAAVADLGTALAAEVPYDSQPDTDLEGVVKRMLEGGPDGLFFISGSLDVAKLAQHARKLAPALPIGASEWAATEQLPELGGKVVEGLLIVQNYDREDTGERFRDFREAYQQRFRRPPGYSSVSAYDAATVLLTALQKRKDGEPAKAAVLKYGPYQGLQQQIAFDANGDTPRKVFFTEIRDGRYVLLK